MGFLTALNTIGQEFVRFSYSMLIQSSILIVVLLLLDLLLRKRVRAVFRYYLWMLILVKLVLPTTLTLPTGVGYWVGDQISAGPVTMPKAVQIEEKNLMGQGPSYVEMKTPESVGPKAVSAVQTPSVSAVAQTPITWQAVLLLGWAFAVIVMTLLMVQRYFFVKGLIAQAGPADDKVIALLHKCGWKMGMLRLPVVKVSPAMVSPAACGLINPVILIPEFLPSKLTEQEMRGVLLHELAHIRRGDLWVNLFQTILQVLYFYNPLLWLANMIIRRVREQAVDETTLVGILDFGFPILDLKKEEKADIGNVYAQTLVNVARVATFRPALSLRMIGVVETKSDLKERIKHILNRPIPQTAKLGVLGLAGIFLFGAILLPMACGKEKKDAQLPIERVNPIPKTEVTIETRNNTTEKTVGGTHPIIEPKLGSSKRHNPFFAIKGTRIYHAKSCPILKDVPQEQLTEISSRSEAEKQGFLSCRYCPPAREKQEQKISIGQGLSYITIELPEFDPEKQPKFISGYNFKSQRVKQTPVPQGQFTKKEQDNRLFQTLMSGNLDMVVLEDSKIGLLRSTLMDDLGDLPFDKAITLDAVKLATHIRKIYSKSSSRAMGEIPSIQEERIETGKTMAVLSGDGVVAVMKAEPVNSKTRTRKFVIATIGQIDFKKLPLPDAPKTQPATQHSEHDKVSAALDSARAWLKLVDEGKYDEGWKNAASFFQTAVSPADWENSIRGIRPAVGKVLSRTVLSTEYATSLPGTPDGEFVVILFKTSFENKKAARETVTPMKEKDGTWKVSGYYIK